MRRKIFGGCFAMLALVTISSCSDSSEQPLSDVMRTPMSFSVSQSDFTRTANYINYVSELRSYYLKAQIGEDAFLSETFNQDKGSGTFSGASGAELYWPMDAQKTVDFFATSMNLMPSGTITGKTVTFNQSDVEDQDLLVAYLSTPTTSDGKVNLNFTHAMAEVGVFLKSPNVKIDYTIYAITLVGESQGIYHFDTGDWTSPSGVASSNITYYDEESTGGFTLSGSDDYRDPTNAHKLVIPGKYKVVVKYVDPNVSTHVATIEKTSDEVTLVRGQRNHIKIVLPTP